MSGPKGESVPLLHREADNRCLFHIYDTVGKEKGNVLRTKNGYDSTNYSQFRTIKGALQAWRFKIGKAESPQCRHRGKAAETGDHLVFSCEKWEEFRKEVWVEEDATARKLMAAGSSRRGMPRESSLYETWLPNLCQRLSYVDRWRSGSVGVGVRGIWGLLAVCLFTFITAVCIYLITYA